MMLNARQQAFVRKASIAVVFASYNGAAWIERVLDGYVGNTDAKSPFVIVAVDNASTDETRVILEDYKKHLPLIVLEELTPGKNRSLNTALDAMMGSDTQVGADFVFTDDDAIPAAGFIDAWQSVLTQNEDYDLFAGQLTPDFGNLDTATAERYEPWHDEIYGRNVGAPGPIPPDRVYGANMAVRGSIIRAGFRFDPDIGPSSANSSYPMGSETEFCVRVAGETGARAWFTDKTEAGHVIRGNQTSERFILERAFRHGKGAAARAALRNSQLTHGLASRLRGLAAQAWAGTGRPDARWNAAWQRGFRVGIRDATTADSSQGTGG